MESLGLDLDGSLLLAVLIKFGISFLLALPIAWEREIASHSLGIRTFPLVAVATCGYFLVGLQFAEGDVQAQARIIQGLITGMGFIGSGAIIKTQDRVKGTATAASIWTTGVLGAAVAHGYYEIAIVVSIVNFLVLQIFTHFFKNESGGQ